MRTLFNNDWFFYEMALDEKSMYSTENEKILFKPEDFYDESKKQLYRPVRIPHDWMISHVKELYKNSAGCYKKTFTLSKEDITDRHLAIRFEGIYMNCAVWVNEKKAGEWKYGYSTFEFDISELVVAGENTIEVIAVYQNCNTRWYSGAGIFRDVTLINTPKEYLISDGIYIVNRPEADTADWTCNITVETAGISDFNSYSIKNTFLDCDGAPVKAELTSEKENTFTYKFTAPKLWDSENPFFYICKTQLFDKNNKLLDETEQHCGFRTIEFTADKGFFINGRHEKLYGVCQHHDLGALGSAFDVTALRRQFLKLKEMGVNAIRCSHNPPPSAFMNLADEMGFFIIDEAFDMWEKPKTPFDYGNYFNEWCEKDTVSWVRRDRNHPCLTMWSIGNEIYDTHIGNGFEITKKLYSYVVQNDPARNAPITIASNYMMTDGAQNCATQIDTVGYNYLERLYDEHHQKHPEWKIYGSETSSTVQSRGIYHFPETLKLVTFSDSQCSALGNCTTPWGAKNTQTVITTDRDCDFSAGQFIWTGWDYIGEPTPYHTKNSYFGQIDTAGFEKDTFFLYKSEWGYKKLPPFVHLLPYWDWNEEQIIDVKAYSNGEAVELFFNGESLGLQKIDHIHGKEPFGQWQLPFHKGELKAVAYDENGKEIAQEVKKSFEDPAKIVLKPEEKLSDDLFFVDVMVADKNDNLVENARNYITVNVAGNAELVGMDNGDSTDYDEYVSENRTTHSRKLFSNRLVAVIRSKVNPNQKGKKPSFVVTAASEGLDNVSIKYDGEKWVEAAPYYAVHAVEDFVPVRKIEIQLEENGNTKLSKENSLVKVTAKVLPENATDKKINWNAVLKECVKSDFIEICDLQGSGSGIETATIKAVSDGECILRCTAQNRTENDEVISDLGFTVTGLGNANLNPYKLIEACRMTDWDSSKPEPTVSLESGISTRASGPSWISFDKVDFGKDGADSIHIPLFSFETELPIEVWDGKPGTGTTYEGSIEPENKDPANGGGLCLGKFTYKHESIYNTYNENVFVLNKRLFGVHTITIVIPHELYCHGFYFDKTPKAFAKLRALDADLISGDTFEKTETAVEKIGNNVTVQFDNINFADCTPVDSKKMQLTICGKSNTENNSINLKFFNDDGTTVTQVIEFAHTNDYEEKTFEIDSLCGNGKLAFVFLPGCNFDFKWFRINR